MSASFHGCELKRDKSHICGLWMLIAAALRYVRGAVERLEWGRRGDRASLGRSARFQRCCKNTHLSAWKGSAVFYQNITSPKPSSSPGAHGTRGYLTTSAEVHCKGISVVLNPARSLCWTGQASLGALLGLKASFSLSTNDPLDFELFKPCRQRQECCQARSVTSTGRWCHPACKWLTSAGLSWALSTDIDTPILWLPGDNQKVQLFLILINPL